MSWSSPPASPARSRTVLTILLGLLLAVGGGLSTAAQAVPGGNGGPGGTVGVDMVINTNGTESRSAVIPSGGGKLHVIKWSCNDADCFDARIRLELQPNVSIGAATASGEWTQSRSGNVVTWSAARLEAGSSSQITFDLNAQASVIPDGTTVSHVAEISADSDPGEVSQSVDMTVRSNATTAVAVERQVGGAVGAWTTLRVTACNRRVNDGSGPLGTEAGSRLVFDLPQGAVVRDVEGNGVVDGAARTITWTLGRIDGGGCPGFNVRLEFVDSDPDNTVGASRTASATWTGALVGRPQGQLGTDTYAFTLDAQATGTGGVQNMQISTTTPQFEDNQNLSWTTVNNTNAVWDDVVIDSDLSEALTPVRVHARAKREPGKLYVAVDGGPLTLVKEIPANGEYAFEPYTTWPDPQGSPLTAGQTITAVRFETGGMQPGDSGELLWVGTKVRRDTIDRTASPTREIQVGDRFTVPSTMRIVDRAGGDRLLPFARDFVITQPNPLLVVRAGGGGTVPRGTTGTVFESSFSVARDKLKNPVMSIRIPAQLRYVAGSGRLASNSTSSIPQPTVTVVPDWAGTPGQTLLRLTWPNGYSMPRDGYVRFLFEIDLDSRAYDNKQIKTFVSSRTNPYDCNEPWFNEGDTADVDDNGDRSRTLCAWGADIRPQTEVRAQVVQSVKGSWDTDYQAGPATSFSSPGSQDSLRTSLVNGGNIRLKDAAVITQLPRAGDTTLLTGSPRTPSTHTFPVVLRGAPQLPTGLNGVTTYWSDQSDLCLPEIGRSPQGCVTPTWQSWASTPPADLEDVTYLKFDFGSNVLLPYTSWDVEIPVTTPTAGATEPDFAVSNPNPADTALDERAVATSAATVTRVDLSSRLTPVESTPVTLQMPGSGGPYTPPATQTLSSTGPWGTDQTQDVDVPDGGSVALLDAGGNPVPSNRLEVSGEGVYVLDPTTGRITFTPEPGHTGTASVSFRVTDEFGGHGDGTYATDVATPAVPDPADQSSTGVVDTAQSRTFAPPRGGRTYLVDPHTLGPVVSDTLTITGQGVYTVDRTTGVVTFTPEAGYHGAVTPVDVAVEDALGQIGYAILSPSITLPAAPTVSTLSLTGGPDAAQRRAVTVPAGGSLALWDGTTAVSSIEVPGQGTYSVQGNEVVFTPVAGFVGQAAPVAYQVTDRFAQVSRSTVSGQVVSPGGVPAGTATPTSQTVRKGAPAALSPLDNVAAPTGEQVRAGSLRIGTTARGATQQRLTTAAGTWQVRPDGDVLFRPSASFVGVSTVHFAVVATDGSVLRSTMSVVVTGTVRGSARATVYFGPRSAALDSTDRGVLRRLAAAVPARATTSALAVGYVQPERFRGNDAQLSKARARNVVQAVARLVDLQRVEVSGKGRAAEQGWKARRATVALEWRVTQR